MTWLRGNVSVREEQATAALEVMSRFALDPRWLVYLSPTTSPCDTSKLAGLLEQPSEVFDYYRNNGVSSVIYEEKHMGSRAVVVASRDAPALERRFGIADECTGVCYTRTGRRFFKDHMLEAQFIERISLALSNAGLWDEGGARWSSKAGQSHLNLWVRRQPSFRPSLRRSCVGRNPWNLAVGTLAFP